MENNLENNSENNFIHRKQENQENSVLFFGAWDIAQSYKCVDESLSKRGFSVVHIPKDRFIHEHGIDNLNKTVEKLCDIHEPKFSLIWKQDNRMLSTLDVFTRKNIPVMVYSWDDPHHIDINPDAIEFSKRCQWTGSCCSGSVEYLLNEGVVNVHWVLPGFSPRYHYYEYSPDYLCDISFVATNIYDPREYPHVMASRATMVRLATKYTNSIKIYGRGEGHMGWLDKTWSDPEIKDLYRGWIDYNDAHLVFSNTLINLNSHVRPDGYKYLNERVFQILGCKGFMLCDKVSGIEEIFDIGIAGEIEVYTSINDFEDKVAFYLKNRDYASKIAERGYKKVMDNYTWDHFVDRLLKHYEGLK